MASPIDPTAPESVAETREVYVVAQLEADCLTSVPSFNAGLRCGITRLRGLGFGPDTPVPTEAHYAALKEADRVIRAALAAYDVCDRECPARQRYLGDKACPRCRAERNEGCGLEGQGATAFIRIARAALDQSK